jgi:dTDP-glucose 4,6-dehydratase
MELKKRGHIVGGTDLRHADGAGLDYYQRADIAQYRQLDRVMSDFSPDYVYHLAAEFGRHNGEEYYEQCWNSNAIGTKNVLQACGKRKTKLIFSSSSEIYGEGDYWDVENIDEAMSDRVPLRQHNDYAISKWVNELQIMNQRKINPDQEIMTLRFFNAYGPGEYYHPYRSVCCLFAYRSLMRQPITVFEGYHRVFMYIDDFIPTLANCSTDSMYQPGNTINIGGSEYRSVEDLHKITSSILGLPTTRPEVSYLKRDGHNTVNKRPNICRAQETLLHNPTILLEEGMKKTIDWMLSVYQVPSNQI